MTQAIIFVPLHHVCTQENNHSGTISVVVVIKAHGKFTEVKKFGVAKSEEEGDEMFRDAQLWLHTHDSQQELDFDDRKGKEVKDTACFLGNIDSVLINGTQLLLNQVYDSIGFNRIPDDILRHLVIARGSPFQSFLCSARHYIKMNEVYIFSDCKFGAFSVNSFSLKYMSFFTQATNLIFSCIN
ncbi:MAG: hypothetical protein KBT29_02225 [Prevotellaceae bacterium]|nr:hypothetical protein [Candidatus Minthosoma caballi]